MAARKPEVVLIPLAYNLETRFQNGIRGLYDHGVHGAMIAAYRRQSDYLEFNMAARKPEVVITLLTYNIESKSEIWVSDHDGHVLLIAAHRRQPDHIEFNRKFQKTRSGSGKRSLIHFNWFTFPYVRL